MLQEVSCKFGLLTNTRRLFGQQVPFKSGCEQAEDDETDQEASFKSVT